MPMYQHDCTHCANNECKKKDQCYRYWLGKNLIKHGWTTAYFYNGEGGENCKYFTNINNY